MDDPESRDISLNQSRGCSVQVGNSICGETNSLDIMKEFNRLYEDWMQQVDSEAGGDCLQEKLKLQQEWIQNLTQQNEMLVRAVQELEYEATERVKQLEEKLHKSAQCLCEGQKVLNEKERIVNELTEKVNYYCSFGDIEHMSKELKCRREECESLKEAMGDVRQVLTEEVASKHDEIIALKKEIQVLEERCSQADKQIIFKDDINKELRKEIKQLKPQMFPERSLTPSISSPVHNENVISKEHNKKELENPYLIIKHTSKREIGRNTVIYISKDGSVQREIKFDDGQGHLGQNVQNHSDICKKCKHNLINKKSFFPSCKSENNLTIMKNNLKPINERSKLTNSSFGRSKTFGDKPESIMKSQFEEHITELGYVPVRMQVNNLEMKKY